MYPAIMATLLTIAVCVGLAKLRPPRTHIRTIKPIMERNVFLNIARVAADRPWGLPHVPVYVTPTPVAVAADPLARPRHRYFDDHMNEITESEYHRRYL